MKVKVQYAEIKRKLPETSRLFHTFPPACKTFMRETFDCFHVVSSHKQYLEMELDDEKNGLAKEEYNGVTFYVPKNKKYSITINDGEAVVTYQ